jgi:hypothetical protein
MPIGGDDLKQLAEAENDDFQEIITLVGMVSKPLHIKRFKKALADYQQTMNNTYSTNNSPKLINQISSNWCLNVREYCLIF